MVRRSIILTVLLVIGLAVPAVAEMAPHQKSDLAVFDEVWRLVDRPLYPTASTPRVRVFIDFLTEVFGAKPSWEKKLKIKLP